MAAAKTHKAGHDDASWRVAVLTYNVNSRTVEEQAVDRLLSHLELTECDLLAIGLQEVAPVEAAGALPSTAVTWARTLMEGVVRHSQHRMTRILVRGLASNQLFVFVRTSRLFRIRSVEARFSKKTVAGFKGTIGCSLTLRGQTDRTRCRLVLATSHFVHDAARYQERILQYHEDRSAVTFDERPTAEGGGSTTAATFWCGDFNFRAENASGEAIAYEAIKMAGARSLDEFVDTVDQLRRARRNHDAFDSFHEAPIMFVPSYKYEVGASTYDMKRTPSWCDRVLYKGAHVVARKYDSIDEVSLSDHKPVFGLYVLGVPTDTNLNYATLAEVRFEHCVDWISTVPLSIQISVSPSYWTAEGSSFDWIALYEVHDLHDRHGTQDSDGGHFKDATNARAWIYAWTTYETKMNDQKVWIAEFGEVPAGRYRAGYWSNRRACLIGLSSPFDVHPGDATAATTTTAVAAARTTSAKPRTSSQGK